MIYHTTYLTLNKSNSGYRPSGHESPYKKTKNMMKEKGKKRIEMKTIDYISNQIRRVARTKKTAQTMATLLLAILMGSSCSQQKNKETIAPIPNYPISAGVSAPFAGFIGDWLIVAGGCNFPDTPAADGGKKVYYPDVYALNTADPQAEWVRQKNLPFAVAYGASVETPDGLVCIGGMNADSLIASVVRIEPTETPDSFALSILPALPEPLDNGAATRTGNRLYLTGGNQTDNAQKLYALSPADEKSWTQISSYPGRKRLQPVLLSDGGNGLYLFGGYALENDTCFMPEEVLHYDTYEQTWSIETRLPNDRQGAPRCLVGATGTTYRQQLMLTGGVNRQIFKDALEGRAPADYMKKTPEWYRFNSDLLLYDTSTREWLTIEGTDDLARAGGILLRKNDTLYMVGGEIKPGVRSNRVTRHQLPEEAKSYLNKNKEAKERHFRHT